MQKLFTMLCFYGLLTSQALNAQELKLKPRKMDAMGGYAFAQSIADSTLSLQHRELIIYKEIKSGNVPNFLRKLHELKDTLVIDQHKFMVSYYTLPDYFAIGSNEDWMYIPMTPILAQRVANLLKCTLPTRKMVNLIYQNANIKLAPQPIPPSKAMTTIPVFVTHNTLVKEQLAPYLQQHNNGQLTAGNKKDVVISNKIYGEKAPKVVIYGWHKLDGKAIQPLYSKHENTWADYSHGIRLIQRKIWVNGKKTKLNKVLANPKLSELLSDEGVIKKAFYPITEY